MPYRIPQVKRKNQTFSCRVSKIVGRELSKLNNNKFCTGKWVKAKRRALWQHLNVEGCRAGAGNSSPNGFQDKRQIMWLCHTWKTAKERKTATQCMAGQCGALWKY